MKTYCDGREVWYNDIDGAFYYRDTGEPVSKPDKYKPIEEILRIHNIGEEDIKYIIKMIKEV